LTFCLSQVGMPIDLEAIAEFLNDPYIGEPSYFSDDLLMFDFVGYKSERQIVTFRIHIHTNDSNIDVLLGVTNGMHDSMTRGVNGKRFNIADPDTLKGMWQCAQDYRKNAWVYYVRSSPNDIRDIL